MNDSTLDPARTALLVMDVQNGIVAGYVSDGNPILDRITEAIAAARGSGQSVVFVRVGFRARHVDVSPNNALFSGVAAAGMMLATDDSTQFHDSLGVQADDVQVVKRRVSAFEGTDLDVILRARGIDTLVLAGIATSGVVLSTVRQAADRDYRVLVLSDGCTDLDDTVHDLLTTKIFPVQATVLASSDYRAQSLGVTTG